MGEITHLRPRLAKSGFLLRVSRIMISRTFADTVSRLAKRLTGIALLIVLGQAAWAAKPNIVFILADDMGYGDVEAINPRSKVPTPNLNRLAKSL